MAGFDHRSRDLLPNAVPDTAISHRLVATLCCTVVLLLLIASPIRAQSDNDASRVNLPLNDPGWLPKGEDGQPLNLDFETGTLKDWTATGRAFAGQPVKGNIDPKRPHGAKKRSLHTGNYWIGGFEKVGDQPHGTLTSVPFVVDGPWCSFLIGGGNHRQTRVELLLASDDSVIAVALGNNEEEMEPVVLNLEKYLGQKIFIRLTDAHSGGWGHVNFDDFRLYKERPKFPPPEILAGPAPSNEVYPYQNLSGDEAARLMQVPQGFRVQCAAQEPLVRQPVAMAIDDRGRVWIAEAYAYPQRDPEGTGRDRILIFEDTDLDGILDKRTIFVDGLNLITGMEVGFGGVWVGAAPYLLFIPDRNQNDIPDHHEPGAYIPPAPEGLQFPKDVPPGVEVVLDGWGFQDTHETLNSFAWGPDGWLYGCHGVFTHSKVGPPGTPEADRVPINAGFWRFHPSRRKFELFAQGTSNPWGIDWNRYGDMFATACVIPHLYYVIPGGRYQRQAGPHFNLNTYDDIKTIARHRHYVGNQWNQSDRNSSDDVGGGHAHAGAMIYQGGAWPSEYDGKLFMNNVHGNRVNVDVLIPEGSGYAGDRNPDFLLTGDKWSQMLAIATGPDGQVWITDWYDQEQCHRNEEGLHDRSNGRIYRVSYGDAKPVEVNLKELNNADLIEQSISAPNDWYVRHARRLIQERSLVNPGILDHVSLLDRIQQEEDVKVLRKLWLLESAGQFEKLPELEITRLLSHPSPQVRSWVVRLLADHLTPEGLTTWQLEQFVELATHDPSPVVRLSIASATQRLPFEQRWPILQRLVAHPEDAQDHNIPLMDWYAMEPLADVDPQRALALGLLAGETIPLLRDFMIRRLGSARPEDALALLLSGLKAAKNDDVRLTFLKGMRGAMSGVRNVRAPAGWKEVYQELIESGVASRNFDVYLYALGLGARFGDQDAAKDLRQIVLDEAGPLAERRVAFNFMLNDRDPQLAEVAGQLLSGGSMRGEAVRALSRVDSAALARAVIEAYKSLPPLEQADARNALSSRVSSAREFMTAIGMNRIPPSDLSAEQVRQLRNLNSREIDASLEKHWGQVRDLHESVPEQLSRYKALIEDPNGPAPNRELGRNVFSRTCQQCHTLFGTGGKVGPDITGANRTNLDYLLTNIIDPSAVMAQEYRPWTLVMDDGRVITGMLKEEDDNKVVVQTTTELLTLAKDEIEARKSGDRSMMPDGLLNKLSPLEIRSLIDYLSGPGQVPILATPNLLSQFFDGHSLQGWHSLPAGIEADWTVDNGELIGRSDGKHLISLVNELSFGNFNLTGEFQVVGGRGEVAAIFRGQMIENGQLRGYQLLADEQAQVELIEANGRGLLATGSRLSDVGTGKWHSFRITAIGSRVQSSVDGKVVSDFIDIPGSRQGIIAWQLLPGAPVELRLKNLKVELREPLPTYALTGSNPLGWPESIPASQNVKISWKKYQLDPAFRSEGCAVADIDNDGNLDVVAGPQWYRQEADGKWTTHSILADPPEFAPSRYSESFLNFAQDLDEDGWVDAIVVGIPGGATTWFRNPGGMTGEDVPTEWQKQTVISVTTNEGPLYTGLLGNGRRVLVSGVENNVMAYSQPQSFPLAPWKINSISTSGAPGTDRYSHGLGAGDINGDGRADVITTAGWWEQPAAQSRNAWRFHPATLGQPCANMYAYDFNGDGRNDVLSSSAHSFGIWWHAQGPESEPEQTRWKSYLIDDSISQTHALVLADINGDGLPDFVTGRRHWAHNGNDPGEDQPAVLCWFEFQRTPEGPRWKKHLIDDNSGVGTQFEVADVNRDGLLDIVTSNKLGTYVFIQQRAANAEPAQSE